MAGNKICKLRRQIVNLQELLKERDLELLEDKLSFSDQKIQNKKKSLPEESRPFKDFYTSSSTFESPELSDLSSPVLPAPSPDPSVVTFDHLSRMLAEKDKVIEKKEELILQKDQVIQFLQAQLAKYEKIDWKESKKRQSLMNSKTIVEHSPNINLKEPNDVTCIKTSTLQTSENNVNPTQKDLDFYEVDLSEEEDRKDRKALLYGRRSKKHIKTDPPESLV